MIYTATFTIERRYRHAPEKLFRAFADAEAKRQWFAGPKGAWQEKERVHDFRVSGSDRVRGVHKGGLESLFISRYHEIVPDRRIVYVYDMHLDGKLISVSLATIELLASEGGTRLVLTEQGAYLEGGEEAYRSRRDGTEQLMRALEASVNES
jgi:uncharacterized protein YndB with AHSA1/START domain